METYNPIFTSVQLGDTIIECPKNRYQWLYPDGYEGRNIVWFMLYHIYLEDFLDTTIINDFFCRGMNWASLRESMANATGHQKLNLLDNCREYYTLESHQQMLIELIMKSYRGKQGAYDIFVKMTKDPELRKLRHGIWMMLK